jgi:hypothetical protein
MDYQPTPSEQLINELTHRGESTYVGASQHVSARLHLSNYTMLQAMTEEAGTSRNQVINQLIATGIDSVLLALPDDAMARIEERRKGILAGLVKANNLEEYKED